MKLPNDRQMLRVAQGVCDPKSRKRCSEHHQNTKNCPIRIQPNQIALIVAAFYLCSRRVKLAGNIKLGQQLGITKVS